MAIVTLSDGTRIKSADVDNATLYAKRTGRKLQTSTGVGKAEKGRAKDRLYVLLKNTKILRLAGQGVRDDAEKLYAAKVPVFINEDKTR